jgi:hypothetical protein
LLVDDRYSVLSLGEWLNAWFCAKCLSWILFECNVLWSDDHNDIGLVVSFWGSTFCLNCFIYLNLCVSLKLTLNANLRALNPFAQLSESAALF